MHSPHCHMGVTFIFLAGALGAVDAGAQAPGRAPSQSPAVLTAFAGEPVLARTANLVVDDVPLAQALRELRHRSGVPIAFSDNLLPDARRTCSCADITVAEALDRLLRGSGLRYVLVETQVLIEPLPRAKTD